MKSPVKLNSAKTTPPVYDAISKHNFPFFVLAVFLFFGGNCPLLEADGSCEEMEAYHSEWEGWTGFFDEGGEELPEQSLRWDLNKPEYDGSPKTPAWAHVSVPEWVKPFQGKNGLPEWEPRYHKPGSTCGGAVAGMDLYHANYYVVYRPETAEYLYSGYTPENVDYMPGTLPGYERIADKYTEADMSDTEKALTLLKEALPAEFRHVGTPPYLGRTKRADRALLDEELLASGGGWCNEQARVFIRLCQVLGIQGRMIHLGGQSHTTAEFYADGQWVLVDVSFYFASRDKEGNLLSAARSHDLGDGQRGWALSRQRGVEKTLRMSADEVNADPEQWKRNRKGLHGRFVAEEAMEDLATNKRLFFGVINTPLPP